MRGNLSIRASSILLLLLAASPPLAAAEAIVDKITIKDGSILKGEIKRVENDELILDTDYADDVVIDVEHIVKIKSKQQFSIRLLSGEIISGFLSVSKGKIVLRESLPAPGETKGADAAKESDFKERPPKAPPTTPTPEVDEVVQQALPTEESELQQTTPAPVVDEVAQQASPTAESQLQQTTPAPVVDEVAQQASPTAESQLQQTTPAPVVDEVAQQASPTAENQLQQTTPAPVADEVVQQASPTAESQLQQTTPAPVVDEVAQQATPDDLPRDEATIEAAKPADVEPWDTPAATERPDGRQFSFDDIDWIREKPTYLRYNSELNVGIQVARGNTDTTDLHFDARFEPSFGWNTFRLSGLYDKKVADGDTTTNRWKASLVYERDFRRRWYVGAANTYESDSQRELDLRIIFAAGIGYRFYDNDPTHFSVIPALAYVRENFEDDTGDSNYAAIQLSMDFERDLYKDDITLYHTNMYLNSLQSLSDINIETQTGIKFDMAWDLVLSAEFETDWENEPAEDAKKLDTRYMLKIGFEFEGDEDDWFQ